MSNKIIGEIAVTIDGEEKTFKVRQLKHSQQMRLLVLLRSSAEDFKLGENNEMLATNLDPEKLGAYQRELCAMRLSDDDGKQLYTVDQVDDFGPDVPKIVAALDKLIGPAKTSVDHSGNS